MNEMNEMNATDGALHLHIAHLTISPPLDLNRPDRIPITHPRLLDPSSLASSSPSPEPASTRPLDPATANHTAIIANCFSMEH
jgi:hypothetical protein